MKKIGVIVIVAIAATNVISAAAGYDAAQHYSHGEIYKVEKMAMAEAEGEGESGKAHVMNVIFNRVESNKFPNTVTEVIYQPGAFASIDNGRYDAAVPDIECIDAMEAIQTQRWDESQGALYFEGVDNADTFHKDNLEFLFQHGNHLFYK